MPARTEIRTFLARSLTGFLVTVFVVLPGRIFSQVVPTHKDIVYAVADGKDLKLDVYIPPGAQPGLLVWVHGGAWRGGNKESVPKIFPENGIATASLDFRQSTEARFPAQVHDIKAAIRFLRGKASEYGIKADRIVIAGSSSGGHLALLAGVTNGNADLEGTLGDHTQQSSNVQGILDYFGASDLTTILAQSTPFGLNTRKPALELLLGALPDQATELARLASPVFHVDNNDPPLLVLHGDQDPQMPINQSHEITGQYLKLNLNVQFEVVYGAAHGGDAFYTPERLKMAIDFVKSVLRNK